MNILEKAHNQTGIGVPIWFMRQAGRYLPEYRALREYFGQFLDLCFDPEAACEVTLQPLLRFPKLSAAIIFSDILIVPYGLGQEVSFHENGVQKGPVLKPFTPHLWEGMKAVTPDLFLEKVSPLFETLQKVRANLAPEKNLIGFAGAPWTLATYMLGALQIRHTAYTQPDFLHEVIDKLVQMVTCLLEAQIRSGADCVQLFDPHSQGLPDDLWTRFCLKPVHKIIASLKEAHPNVPILLYTKVTSFLLNDLNPDVLSIDTAVPLSYARNILQPRVAIQGNLDPELLVVGGGALTKRVQAILDSLAHGPFIFNLGHGILPTTPIDHVSQVVEQVTNFKRVGKV